MKSFFVWKRARAIAKKEVFHILRDPFTLALALGMPILMVVIYGFAIEFNVKEIHLAVSDADQSQTSRRLIETFRSSDYFLTTSGFSPREVQKKVEDESVRAGLIIPPRFEKDVFA